MLCDVTRIDCVAAHRAVGEKGARAIDVRAIAVRIRLALAAMRTTKPRERTRNAVGGTLRGEARAELLHITIAMRLATAKRGCAERIQRARAIHTALLDVARTC